MSEHRQIISGHQRHLLLLALFGLAFAALVLRAVDLQVLKRGFLQGQADARHLRTVSIPAHRGMILDRNGEPLAVSTPVDSVWANPQELAGAREFLPALARLLGMEVDELQGRVARRADREFVYLRRQVNPTVAAQLRTLDAPGVYLQREYRRYYPDGEVAAHVVHDGAADGEAETRATAARRGSSWPTTTGCVASRVPSGCSRTGGIMSSKTSSVFARPGRGAI